jgi:PKD repeat protein
MILFFLFFVSCQADQPVLNGTIKASFAFSPASPAVGQATQFTDLSTGVPNSWEWKFGDLSSSTTQNPKHTFTAAGPYTVVLTASNATSSGSTSRTITVGVVLTAAFSYNPALPAPGQAIQFTDTSSGSPTSWQWNFGDGATSTSPNPNHTYTSTGTYTVSLTVSDGTTSADTSRGITVAPEAPGYYVDGSNPNASDSNPGTEALPWKTINKANRYLSAGDSVYIKAGTYTNGIAPVRSGTESQRISFRAYGSDIVTITGGAYTGVDLDGVSYITVQGINFYKLPHFLYIENNAHHNIVAYCNFDDDNGQVDWRGSTIYYSSKYNWVHHCRFSNVGRYTSLDDTGVILEIGNEDQTSYNLVEDNVFYHGGHHCVGIGGNHNVFRNNYLHNEGWWTSAAEGGPWGNRVFFSVGFDSNTERNLIEGNRIAFGGETAEPDQIGGAGGTMASRRNIIRKNVFDHTLIYALRMVTYAGQGTCTDNKIYNNSFWHCGYSTTGPLKRNYWSDDYTHAILFVYDGGGVQNNVVKNNIFYDNKNVGNPTRPVIKTGGGLPTMQVVQNNWLEQGDPKFTTIAGTPDPMSEFQFDLRLQASSPCIDVGGALTTITSASGSGTVFSVADAGYFMDGWGIPGVVGDQIQILGTSRKAQITNVNYDTNTITVDVALTWTQGQGIVLAYVGSSPDLGAFEYGSQS